MSVNCPSYSQNCYLECCDYYGNCPLLGSDCYYYYYHRSTAGMIVGIVVGIVFFIALFMVLLYLCRRCRRRNYLPAQAPAVPPPGPRVQVLDPYNPYQPQRLPNQPPAYNNQEPIYFQQNPYSNPYNADARPP